MRETLFRGKRIDTGEWVYGDFYHKCGVTGIVHDYMISTRDGAAYPAIPETVGQYTGLDDKNGVKIFEWDIVLYEPFETHNNDRVIIYENGAFRGRLIRNGYSKLLGDLDSLNIIGNIYDNPELMEG